MKFSVRRILLISLLLLSCVYLVNAQGSGAPDCGCWDTFNDMSDPWGCNGLVENCEELQDCLDSCTGVPVNGSVWALVAAGMVLGLSSISRAKLKKSIGTFFNKTIK